MNEQLKIADKVVDVVDRANRMICVTLLLYSVFKPKSCFAQVRLLARKKEDEKFQPIAYKTYKHKVIIYLLDFMESVSDKDITFVPFLLSVRIRLSCNN